MAPDINRLIELQKLLDAFTAVDREAHRKYDDKITAENDTEHSYNLAMTSWYLAAWFPELDKNLLIQYGMVHDLVEIYAGDTFSYGSAEDLASKEHREAEALKRLEIEWRDFPDMISSIEAYETKKTPEAKFVYALDKLMPIMLIYLHEGYSWQKHGVTAAMLYENKITKVSLSPEILPYFEQLHKLLLEHPELFKKS